jgi:hypothetical protein
LPPIDEELKLQLGEDAKEFISQFTFVPTMHKKIEQVGSGYEKLKKLVAK